VQLQSANRQTTGSQRDSEIQMKREVTYGLDCNNAVWVEQSHAT